MTLQNTLDRLQKELSRLQKQYDLLSEKLQELETAYIIKDDPGVRFQLKKEIEETRTDRDRIEKEIEEIEKQIEQTEEERNEFEQEIDYIEDEVKDEERQLILTDFLREDRSGSFKGQENPWPNHLVCYQQASSYLPKELQRIIDEARTLCSIQKWFEENLITLLWLLGGNDRGWIFVKPKLGEEFIPDFMLCGFDSRGYHWHLLKLENPKYLALTRSSQQSTKLNQAIQQIRDWRIWLRKNIQYVQNELGYKDLDAEFEGYIIIGRRKNMNRKEKERYRELSRDRLTVMTYDRLIDNVAGFGKHISSKGNIL